MTTSTENFPEAAAGRPDLTRGFSLNHTMLRVKEPERSLDFYGRVLGMRLLRRIDFAELRFSLYFLRYCSPDESIPPDCSERTRWLFGQSGVLELTHNWGSEADPDFSYHDGNQQPQGFGHLCVAVTDLAAAVSWFDENNIAFVKRPADGKMKDIAFIKDPDGYWIEIVQPELLGELGDASGDS